jgi:hypothetical protein
LTIDCGAAIVPSVFSSAVSFYWRDKLSDSPLDRTILVAVQGRMTIAATSETKLDVDLVGFKSMPRPVRGYVRGDSWQSGRAFPESIGNDSEYSESKDESPRFQLSELFQKYFRAP